MSEREQKYAAAMERFFGSVLYPAPAKPEIFYANAARAVMAVADAEQAEARAEIERLSRPHRMRPEVRNAWKDRAEAAEAQVAHLSRECLDRESTEMDKASRLAAAEAQLRRRLRRLRMSGDVRASKDCTYCNGTGQCADCEGRCQHCIDEHATDGERDG